jgi:multicomponent Na+:H+ antiporter subunit B
MTKDRAKGILSGTAVAVLAIAALAPIILSDAPWPVASRDLLAASGFDDTGAENLVSAIYLGYRAYDTLGETIVLLAALAGAVSLIAAERSGDYLAARQAAGRRHTRTEILNVIAGKLAPIVLLFGAYVMLYGHASPGGGFQGGVVLASGIMFIALGRRSGGVGRIDPSLAAFGHASLARMEAWAFAAILLLSFPGNGRAMEAIRGFAGSLGLAIPAVSYIIALNVIIGLKVGSGVALMCILMMGGETE